MNELTDQLTYSLKGHIRVFPEHKPEQVIYEDHNVIVTTVKSLFARLMKNSLEPQFGVWGLALGSGDASWSSSTQPDATANQTALITQLLRKRLSSSNFVDTNLNPLTSTFSNQVDFQTLVNATTDNIQGSQIREMGLIGGGSTSAATNMLTAPYWDPNTLLANSVTLINYKTLPPLILPPGVNIIFSWVLSF